MATAIDQKLLAKAVALMVTLSTAEEDTPKHNLWLKLGDMIGEDLDQISIWMCTSHPYLGCAPVEHLARGGTISSIETAVYLTFPIEPTG